MAPSIATPRIDAQKPRASAAGSAPDHPAAGSQVLADRALGLGVEALEGLVHAGRQVLPRVDEQRGLHKAKESRRLERRVHDGAHVGPRTALGLPCLFDLGCRPQHTATRRLDEEGLLAAEVVRDLAREGAGCARDLGGGYIREPAFPEQPAGSVEQRPPRLPARRARCPWIRVRAHRVDCASYKQRSQGVLHHRDRYGSPPRRGGDPDRCPRRVLGLCTRSPKKANSMTPSQPSRPAAAQKRTPRPPMRHPVTGRASSDLVKRPRPSDRRTT